VRGRYLDRVKVGSHRRRIDQCFAFDVFGAAAARMRVFNAASSIVSPSCKSMARRVLPK
jgi:hypothetical protein